MTFNELLDSTDTLFVLYKMGRLNIRGKCMKSTAYFQVENKSVCDFREVVINVYFR